MNINKVVSYGCAWDILKENTVAYEELVSALKMITPELLVDPKYGGRFNRDPSEEISPLNFTRCWDKIMEDLQWGSCRGKSNRPGGINIYIRNYKHRIAVKMMSSDRMMNFPSWVLIEAPRIVSTEICDVAILVMPTADLAAKYGSNIKYVPFHFIERAQAQLNDLLPINQVQPFLIIGFSQEESDIEVVEILPSGVENIVERVLEFPRELYQAGVGILSYFGEVLKQKYPDIEAKVRIEQDGNVVRMTVDAPDGTRDIIEKTLQDFALVVTNQASPETLLDNQFQIHALSNKLMLAEMEVRQVRDLMRISESYQGERIQSLEQDVCFLREQIGHQVRFIGMSHQLLSDQSAMGERLIMAQIDSSRRTLDEMVADAWDSAEVKSALLAIKLSLESGNPPNEAKVKEALVTVRDLAPTTFSDLTEALKGTLYGVSGNTVFLCLQQVAKMFG
jgi:hypothetical protein